VYTFLSARRAAALSDAVYLADHVMLVSALSL
jgi:hypothetical protein